MHRVEPFQMVEDRSLMRTLAIPLLVITSLLLAVSIGLHLFRSGTTPSITPGSADPPATTTPYRPALEHDPPIPQPPENIASEFTTFLGRLKEASADSSSSLVLERDARDHAELLFRSSSGVPEDLRIEMHSPFFEVDPEGIFALYVDLPALEQGLALFQQNCAGCHGPYGRGNGSATHQWYSGNYPRNFNYAKFKSRSTEYGAVPTDSDIFRTLTRGLYGSSMPPFGHLSVKDRWSLVVFIKSLGNFHDDYDEVVINRFDPDFGGRKSEPLEMGEKPKVTIESVTRGRILFIEQACVICHQGKKPTPVGLSRWEGSFDNWYDEMNRPIQNSRNLTNRVFRSGAASSDLFRIISDGPTIGPMPSYRNLPQQDLWALVHYVESVFKPDYPQAPPSADALAKPPKPLDLEPASEAPQQ
jgi:mono/diheme cytochrome c family protein